MLKKIVDYGHHYILPSNAFFYVVTLIALALTLVFTFQPDHVLVRYYSDDAFYYFQTAWHLSLGHGPTFDGITWTTGFHPLYAILLTFIHDLGNQNKEWFPAFANLLNACAFFVTAFFLYLAAKSVWGKKAAIWAALLWFCNPHSIILICTGMEGSVYAAILGLYLYATSLLFFSSITKNYILYILFSGLAGSLCILSRTDSMLLIVLISGLIFLIPKLKISLKTVYFLLYLSIAFIPYFLWSYYCYELTGEWVQGSAQQKTIIRGWRTEDAGILGEAFYTISFFAKWIVKNLVKTPILKYLLILLFFTGTYNYFSLKSKNNLHQKLYYFSLLLFLIGLGVAYALFLPKAWTWYYAPGLVILTFLSSGLLFLIMNQNKNNNFYKYFYIFLILTLIESYGYLTLKTVTGRNAAQTAMLHNAVWMKENLPEDAVIGAWNSGIYGWYSNRAVINLDGLINNDIAHLYQNNKSLYKYIVEKNINYIADDSHYIERYFPEQSHEFQEIYVYSNNELSVSIWKVKS